jgi:hypothetical protein
VVLVEALTSRPGRDVNENRLLKACQLVEAIPLATARRAAALHSRAGRGSAVDAVVVAVAEPGGTVLSGDVGDLRALADHADGVTVERV